MIAIRSLDDLEQAPLSPVVRRANGCNIVLDDPADNEALRPVSARISHQTSTAVADPGAAASWPSS